MQIKDNRWNKQYLLNVVKVILIIGSLFFLYEKMTHNTVKLTMVSIPTSFPFVFTFVLLLMLLNWSLEARRWQLSVNVYESISFHQALKVVLQGLAMNMVFPFTAGDAAARILPMNDRFQTTSAMLLNRGIMLLITLVFGLYGMYIWSGLTISISHLTIFFIGGSIALLFLFRNQLNPFLMYFKTMNGQLIWEILLLSIIRYVVFVGQFVLLLSIFLPHISLEILFAGVGWVFFVRSVFPSTLGGVGIREASGVLFFQEMVSDLSVVIFPIFLLWIINTLVPALFGLVSILKLKVKIAR